MGDGPGALAALKGIGASGGIEAAICALARGPLDDPTALQGRCIFGGLNAALVLGAV